MSCDRHCLPSVGCVECIADLALLGLLVGEVIQQIVRPCDRSRNRVGRPGQAIAAIPTVGNRALVAAAALAEAREDAAVESVVLVGRNLAAAIGMLSQVTLASEEETEEVP